MRTLLGILGSLLVAGVVSVTPVGAQTTTAVSNLGQDVKACNQTYKDGVKAIQADFKAKKITKAEHITKLKDLNQVKLGCIKTAKTKARDQAKRVAEEQKAKRAQERKMRQEEAKRKADEQKAKAAEQRAKKQSNHR